MPDASAFENMPDEPGDKPREAAGPGRGPDVDGPVADQDGTDFTCYGWLPFWRAWQKEWWWSGDKKNPWSMAQFFLHLLLEANRKSRTGRYLHRVVHIDRGCLATSYEALAARSGHSRKVVTRMVRDLADAGEVEVLDKGGDGVLLKISKYDVYTFAPTQRDSEGHNAEPASGCAGGRHRHAGGTGEGQQRHTPRYGKHYETPRNGKKGGKSEK
jgi:hypothetical protein